jgi:hypothetical protein
MYEGDVMFEHCYRLDIDVAVPTPEKRACWDRWLATGTRGQTRDRVEFAAARSRALLAAPSASGVAFLHIAAPMPTDSASSTSVACPLPETPFEAPPSTLASRPTAPSSVSPAASASAALAPTTPAAKRQFCIDACAGQLATCVGLCGTVRCGQKCSEEVKSCMTDCL